MSARVTSNLGPSSCAPLSVETSCASGDEYRVVGVVERRPGGVAIFRCLKRPPPTNRNRHAQASAGLPSRPGAAPRRTAQEAFSP